MEARETPFLFVGNQLCLDFINTESIATGQRQSLIQNFADLEAWLLEAGVMRKADIDALTSSLDRQDKEWFARRSLAFRDTLRRMAERITTGQPVSEEGIASINHWLKQRKGYQVLHQTEEGCVAAVHYEQSVDGLLSPIAESASDLLVHTDRTLVRKCESSQCILYFYDTSKNHARRWCNMSMCGNRFKVASHYRRSRQENNADSLTSLSRPLDCHCPEM